MSKMAKGIRSFIALDITDEIRAKLGPILQDLEDSRADLRMVDPVNLHFTVKFLGNITQDTIDRIAECMESVQGLLGFDIKVQGLGAFPRASRPRVIWVGVSDGRDRMVALSERLDAELSALGFEKERSHVPHLTLARSRRRGRNPEIAAFLEKMGDLEIGTMHVDNLVLKRSDLSPRGPTYSDILKVEASGD